MEALWSIDIGTTLCHTILAFLIVSVVIFILVQNNHFLDKTNYPSKHLVSVFVTAHPDDECMFFGPALLQTVKQNPHNVYVLCLTTGNFENKGTARRKELYESCRILGILPSHVDIWDSSSFLDGSEEWDFDILLPKLVNYMRKLRPDYVFTFDSFGVSGHLNHIATSKAVKLSVKKFKSEDKTPVIFELESVPLYRKYVSVMDIPVSLMGNRNVFISSLGSIFKTRSAMHAHKTQLIWFRHLYIIFSRYMLINTFNKVVIDNNSS